MGAYADACAHLGPAALAHVDELVACAPPLTPSQERTIQRALGPCVLPLAADTPQAA